MPQIQPRIFLVIMLIFMSPFHAINTEAETSPSSGVRWIDWAAAQVSFALQEAIPPEPTPPAPAASTQIPASHSIETIEINRLREEVRLLRDLIEQGVIGRVISLENEVRMLRSALGRQQLSPYTAGSSIPQPGTPIPRPTEFTAINPVPAQPKDLPEAPPEPFSFTVVDEWGRSPEVAAELGNNASTLIGIAGVVPPRSSKTDVVALLQKLHRKYAAYDNMDIEIFDTREAAQNFATRQSVDATHHIASISRYKASGRDLMLYFANGKAEPIPPEAE